MKRNNFFRNICIGLVDGLTIPLALAACLSGLVASSSTVIISCMAAAVAGTLTMSIGGYQESKKYPEAANPIFSAITIGTGYLSGGLITTLSYYFESNPLQALKYSAVITLIFLFAAGYWESKLNGSGGWINAIRVCITGAIAALAAFLISKSF